MEYSKVGTIAGTFGIKGEVKVISYSDFINERFGPGASLLIEKNGEYIGMEVATLRMIKGRVVISFKDHQDINKIEMYKDCDLYIPKEQRHTTEENEYYPDQIIGLKVVQNGRDLGTVSDVDFLVSNPVIRVTKDDKSFLLPFVPSFIADVDEENKILTINPEVGLQL